MTSQARPFVRAPRSALRVREIEAAIRSSDEGFAGDVRVREADRSLSSRDVRGATCAEVFSALSLVAAITIDTGPPEPRPPPPEAPDVPPALPEPPRWRFAVTLGGGLFFGVPTDWAGGVAPSFEVHPPLGAPLTLLVSATLAASPRTTTPAGSADFLWFSGRTGAGLTALRAGPFSFGAVTTIGAGIVRGRGFAIAAPREQVRPWADVTLGARVLWSFHGSLGLELAGGALVPLTRDTWVFDDPDVIVHQTPDVGGFLTLALRVSLSP